MKYLAPTAASTKRGRSSVSSLLLIVALLSSLLAPVRLAAADNLLSNGSFETYHVYATDPGTGTRLTLADGWTAFVQSGEPYFMSVVDFAGSPWGVGWVERYEGDNNQMIFTPDGPGAFVSGVYQRVTGVTPGTAYAFSGRILTLGFDPMVTKELGFDPWGGTDPSSPNVEWGFSAPANQDNRWQNVYMAALAKSAILTVFIRVKHPLVYGPGNSETFLDAFVLNAAPIVHTSALSPFRTDPSIPVTWGLDWLPPETFLDWPSAWFQVQARDGVGTWQDWLAKTPGVSAAYPGQDCHTYYFQSRAVVMHPMISNVGSRLPSYWPGGDGQAHTTLLAVPPTSAAVPLPATQTCPLFPVEWTGSGGSCGLTGYDVQVRDGSGGAWTDWLANTASTLAEFSAADGHSYSFRSRAAGIAGYWEPYSAEGDAQTTVRAVPPLASITSLASPQITTTWPITWSGGTPGCGLTSVEVFTRSVRLSDDQDSGWVLWHSAETGGADVFAAAENVLYRFLVSAADRSGLVSEAGTYAVALSEPRAVLVGSRVTAAPELVFPGGVVSYQAALDNRGNLTAAAAVTVTLPLTLGTLAPGSAVASSGILTVTGSTLAWSGEIPPGATATVDAVVQVSMTTSRGSRAPVSVQIWDGLHPVITRTAAALIPYSVFVPLAVRGANEPVVAAF